MPRLDSNRIGAWQRLRLSIGDIERVLDRELDDEHGVTLAWFDCLTVIRDAGGTMRVKDLCAALHEVPSSLSRRLDRMEDEGLVMREPAPLPDDRRAVTVSLTKDGRLAWRDANITFRRVVQQRFAALLSDAEIDTYLQIEQPFDCAGSAKVEALGITLLDAVHSDDPTALVGLPLIATHQMLADAGLPVLRALASSTASHPHP